MVRTDCIRVQKECEKCGAVFFPQKQSLARGQGRCCSAKCYGSHNKGKHKHPLGLTRDTILRECPSCHKPFKTRVKNIARGGGVYCSKKCNPVYSPRHTKKEIARRSNLKSKYGISLQDFDNMVKRQGGKCLICDNKPNHKHRKLFVDHCHESGKVRGLLCGQCNAGLGMFHENVTTLTRAIEYLKT